MSRATESRTATAYARLREHLAYLGLVDGVGAPRGRARAGEHRDGGPGRGPRAPPRGRGGGDGGPPAVGTPALRPLPARQAPRAVRVRLPALDRPGGHRRALHPALRRGAPQRPVPRAAGGRQEPSRDRTGDRRHRGRLPDLLHDRGRPRRPTSRRRTSRGAGARRCGRTPGPRCSSSTSSATCRWTPRSAHWIFQVVSRRYERGSIVLTSNRGFGDWGAGVRRRGRRHRHPRPAPAPRHGRQHQAASPTGCGPTCRQPGRALLCSADADRLCTFRGDLSARFVLTHSRPCSATRRSVSCARGFARPIGRTRLPSHVRGCTGRKEEFMNSRPSRFGMLVATLAIVASACSGSATPTPAASAAPSVEPSMRQPRPPRPSRRARPRPRPPRRSRSAS